MDDGEFGAYDDQGESFVVDSISPDRKWAVIFEDDSETGYMYLCYWDMQRGLNGIADHLWIYNQIKPPIQECKDVFVIWNDDSTRAGLIVDNEYWGIFDLKIQRKMSAPRANGCIKSIEQEYWDNGLCVDEGEVIIYKPKNEC